MQPPGVTAAENLLKENDGYAGMEASLENIYIAGSIVIDELLSNWDQYAETVQAAAGSGGCLAQGCSSQSRFQHPSAKQLAAFVKRLLVMTVLIVLPHGSVAAVADYYESIKQDPVKLRQFLQQFPKGGAA